VWISGWHEDSGVIANHVRNSTDIRSDDRNAMGHGFNNAVRRSFGQRWQHKHIQTTHECTAAERLRVKAHKFARIAKRQRARTSFDLEELWSSTGNSNHCQARFAIDSGQRLQQYKRSFAFFQSSRKTENNAFRRNQRPR